MRAVDAAVIAGLGGVLAPRPDFAIYLPFELYVYAPITEELVFQVALQTRLTRFGTLASILLTTIVFTLFHLDDFAHYPTNAELISHVPLFFGLSMFAILRSWNGSLVGLVIAHALTNWLVFTFAPQLPAAG